MIQYTIVRKAKPDDATAIALIEKLAFSQPWSEASILSEIQKENAVFLVCEKDGDLAGYVSMETVCGECYIGNLAVGRLYRRRGVATLLLSELTYFAKEMKCSFITLEVRKSNVAARALYEKAGYTVQGVRRGFYTSPDEDAVIYTLYL